MAHRCPVCLNYCTCNGDIDDFFLHQSPIYCECCREEDDYFHDDDELSFDDKIAVGVAEAMPEC